VLRDKAVLIILLFLAIPLHAFCWGFFAHKQINYDAVFLLPPAMISFYKQNIDFLAEHAVDPDKRRYAIPEEGPRHYIDMDRYGSFPFENLPQHWGDAIQHYSEDSLVSHGIAPWWISTMQGRLKKAFELKNPESILKLSAEIGHYIADIHVPLHTSSNHNGQKTDQVGIHGFWESRLPELFAQQQYDLINGKAQYIENPIQYIWQRVYESALASDSVLALEKNLANSTPSDLKFAFEKRNGMIVKQYSSTYARLYHTKLHGMVERRMRSSIFTVAGFWYTAWVDAGQPDLQHLGKVSLSSETLIDQKLLQSAWLAAKIMGRSCSN